MLDAAVSEFARHGFHAASMDDIAARADVSKPMVYAYLGSKDDLFVACLHREGTRLMEEIVEVVDPHVGVDEQLWRGVNAFFGYVAAHRDGWTLLFRQEHGAAELRGMRVRMIEVVTGLLTRAIGDRPTSAADLESMAFALIGACESLADRLVDHADERPEDTARRLMDMVWLGAERQLDGAAWRPADDIG
jgi:AcrR family transcriptional regulator